MVRSATEDDRPAIIELVGAAFHAHDGGREELDIVRATWAGTASAYDLVAVRGTTVVGHVLCAWGDLGGRRALAVAPLAVEPGHQRGGVGTALMHELIARADGDGHPMLLLLGDPAYYDRFGFEASGPSGITYPAAGAGSSYFQVRRLAAYDPTFHGDFTYCWELP